MKIPARRPISPKLARAQNTTVAAIRTGPSHRMTLIRATTGQISAAMPSTSRMLAILLPTTLPMAIAGLFSQTEMRLTNSSGALVPAATTERPMTSGDAPDRLASDTAPRTSHSPP